MNCDTSVFTRRETIAATSLVATSFLMAISNVTFAAPKQIAEPAQTQKCDPAPTSVNAMIITADAASAAVFA